MEQVTGGQILDAEAVSWGELLLSGHPVSSCRETKRGVCLLEERSLFSLQLNEAVQQNIIITAAFEIWTLIQTSLHT